MVRSRRQGYHRGELDRRCVEISFTPAAPEVGDTSRGPPTVIIVTNIVATSFSCPSLTATTSPLHTVTVRPGLVTRPPCPGERKFTLYSTVRRMRGYKHHPAVRCCHESRRTTAAALN